MDFLDNLLNDALLVNLSKTLLHFLWQGAALALLLFLVLKLVGKQHSRVRYLLCLFFLGLNVIAPAITFLHFNQSPISIEPVSEASIAIATSQATVIVSSANEFNWQTLLPMIALFWLIGVCWLSAKLIYEVHKVNKLPLFGTSPAEQHIQALFEQLIEQLNVSSLTRLKVSIKAEVPMVIGWLRPVVLVPASMVVGLTPAQLEMLLAHELAHVKRHDYLINFFQTLVEVLFFFHPCVKWASNQARVEREYCCDDIAVDCCGNPTAYARALTNAELIRKENIPQLAMAATGGNLKKRVFRLVDQYDCSAKQSNSLMSTLVAGITGIGLVLVFIAAPHMATAKLATNSQPDSLIPELEDTLKVSDENFQDNENINEPPAVFSTEERQSDDVLPSPNESNNQIILNTGEFSQSKQNESYNDILTNDDQALDSSTEELQLMSEPVQRQNTPPLPPTETIETVSENRSDTVSTATNIAQKNSAQIGLDKENYADTVPVVAQTSTINTPIVEEIEKAQQKYEPVVVNPKLLRSFAPRYPKRALRKGLEVEFSVTFTVNAQGRVVEPKFGEGVSKSFQKAVKLALNRWRFKAGTVDGKSQPMEQNKVFSFTNPGDVKRHFVTGSRLPKNS